MVIFLVNENHLTAATLISRIFSAEWKRNIANWNPQKTRQPAAENWIIKLENECKAVACLTPATKNKQKEGAAHFVGGVLGVWLALGCPAGHGTSTDVAEVDLALRGRAASRLAPNNDGTAWQDLEESRAEQFRIYSDVATQTTKTRKSHRWKEELSMGSRFLSAPPCVHPKQLWNLHLMCRKPLRN